MVKYVDVYLLIRIEEAESVKQQALELENVKAHTDGKEIKKIIYVPNKIVNIVVK